MLFVIAGGLIPDEGVSRLIALLDFGRGNLWDGAAGRIASLIDDLLATLEGGSAKGLAAVDIASAGVLWLTGGVHDTGLYEDTETSGGGFLHENRMLLWGFEPQSSA